MTDPTPRNRRAAPRGRAALALLLALPFAACGAAHPPTGEVHGPLGTALDRYMSRLEAFGFSGSILVAQKGQVVIDKGYGLADRAKKVPYTAATIFDIASISKQFTAAAVVKLEQEGKLKLDETIGRFFPGAVPPDKQEITLHQLLTHSSGLGDSFGEEYEAVSRQELVRRVLTSPLLGPPGKKFRYSNGGYNLLAAVIEVASGQGYESYLREHVWQPAGLADTGFHVAARERIAHGYGLEGDWGTPLDHPWAPDGPYWNLRGNGGILSTTGDLFRWHTALAGTRVLSHEESAKTITPYIWESQQHHSRYAYGWSITQDPRGGRLASHVGGNLVFESDFRRYLDADSVIVLSSNSADYSAIEIGPHIENRLFGLPDPEPPGAAPADAAALQKAAGTYAFAGGDRMVVKVDGDRLAVTAGGPEAFAALLGAPANERQRIAKREAKVAVVLAALPGGDLGPLSNLLGLSPEETAVRHRASLGPIVQKLGALRGGQLLGSGAFGGHLYTYARLNFEKGTKIVEYGWTGPAVETIHFSDAPRANVFLPQADGSFATFDVRGGTTVRLAFAPAGKGPGALTVRDPQGEVQAQKIE